MSWEFSKPGVPYLSNCSSQSITLHHPSTTTPSVIPITPNTQPFRCLGVYLRPDQSMQSQYEILHEKSHRLAHAIAGSTVSRREAFLMYFAVFQPSISYVLPLTTFTSKQCHSMSSLPTRLFLQKCGFCSTTHRSIVFGSRSSGGIGFRPLFQEQGIQHVTKFIQALRTPTQARNLLIIAILWWQLNSGMDYSLLEFPNRSCPHLEGTWLTSTRSFLASINATITLSFHLYPSIFRHHDSSIMRAIVEQSKLGPKRLRIINACREFYISVQP